MSTTTYVFVQKLDKYSYFLVEKSALSRAMNIYFLFLHENICRGYSEEVPH